MRVCDAAAHRLRLTVRAETSVSLGSRVGLGRRLTSFCRFRLVCRWNSFREDPGYDQALLLEMFDALNAPIGGDAGNTTMVSAGYTMITLDLGWEACGAGVDGSFHDAAGNPIVNTTKLPDLKGLVATARAKNLSPWW